MVLSQGGLPVAYRAAFSFSAQNRSRTCKRLGLSQAALPLAYLGASGPGWNRTIVSWMWAKCRCRWTTGPCCSSVDPPGVAPGSPACDTGIFLLDDEPIYRTRRKSWDSNPQADMPLPVFKTGSSSSRMTSDYKLRELESNQRPPGSEPGVATNSDYPASVLFYDTRDLETVRRKLRGQESNLRTPGSKPGVTTNSDCPATHKKGRAGLEPARWCLTGTCSAAELPTQ